MLTLYRLDKLLLPMIALRRNTEKKRLDVDLWEVRWNCLYQTWRVLLDVLCLPLAMFVCVTLFRAPAAIMELYSKWRQPIRTPAVLRMARASVEINGRKGVQRSTVSLHVEAMLNGSDARLGPNALANFPIDQMRLRIFGSDAFWAMLRRRLGRVATYRIKSAMPIGLVDANLNRSRVELGVVGLRRQERTAAAAAAMAQRGGGGEAKTSDLMRVPSIHEDDDTDDGVVVATSGQLDGRTGTTLSFTLSLFLPFEKKYVRERLQRISTSYREIEPIGFQVEVKTANTWKKLISSSVPVPPLLMAADREDPVVDAPVATLAAVTDPSFYAGNASVSDDGSAHFVGMNKETTAPSPVVAIAAVAVPPPAAEPLPSFEADHRWQNHSTRMLGKDSRDVRDSFAEVFAVSFTYACVDMLHLALCVMVFVLAPWRGLVLVFRICEPRRRLSVRIAQRYLSRIRDSFALDFERGRESFILAANEGAKEIKDLDSRDLRHAESDADASLKTYLSKGSDLEGKPLFMRAKRRLARHSEAMREWVGRLERELKVDAWDEADDADDVGENDGGDVNNDNSNQRVPFLRELKTWAGLKEAELYYTSLNMQLNRARMCNLFPLPTALNTSGVQDMQQQHEALPCLVEELRGAHANFQSMCTRAEDRVVALQASWVDARMASSGGLCEWGAWWKTAREIRSLIRYYLRAALEDLFYLLLNLLIVFTIYRIPAVLRDLGRVPGISFGSALCSWLSPAGTYRVRRAITRNHTAGIILDIRLLFENVFLFLVVCLLVVRVPSYLAYLPFIKGGYDLKRKAREDIWESWGVLREVFLFGCLKDTWVIAGKALLFSVLMPAVSNADMLVGVLPCCSKSAHFFVGIALWLILLFMPLAILGVVGEGYYPSSESAALGGVPPLLAYYGLAVLVLLFVSACVTCMRTAKVRRVSTAVWSAPVMRMDQFPNLLALFQAPLETGLLLLATMAAFNTNVLSSVDNVARDTAPFHDLMEPNALRWPSFAEASASGSAMRGLNVLALLLALLWVFVLSVPLGIGMNMKTGEDARIAKRRAAAQRREITQSSFYNNMTTALSSALFLPIVFGLALPLRCVAPMTAARNENATLTNLGNATATADLFACWDHASPTEPHTHVDRLALSIVLMLVVVLTNIASSVGSRAAQEAALTAAAEKDNGLDMVYADAYSSGVKLLQVVLVLTTLTGSLESSSGAGLAVVVAVAAACMLCLWTPVYYFVVAGCKCPSRRGSGLGTANIVASIPWVVALRVCGFFCVFVTAALLYVAPATSFANDTHATAGTVPHPQSRTKTNGSDSRYPIKNVRRCVTYTIGSRVARMRSCAPQCPTSASILDVIRALSAAASDQCILALSHRTRSRHSSLGRGAFGSGSLVIRVTASRIRDAQYSGACVARVRIASSSPSSTTPANDAGSILVSRRR